jgi:hypothetical protein
MFASFVHTLLFPTIAFVVAASVGIVIRQRGAREDKRYRDLRFN